MLFHCLHLVLNIDFAWQKLALTCKILTSFMTMWCTDLATTILLITYSWNSLDGHDTRLDHAYFEISELSKPTWGCRTSEENLWSPSIGHFSPSAACTLICCFSPVTGSSCKRAHVLWFMSRIVNFVFAFLKPAALKSWIKKRKILNQLSDKKLELKYYNCDIDNFRSPV